MRPVDHAKLERKRAEIMRAALTCFIQRGFQQTTILDICKEAGISSGSLYHHFESKEALITATLEDRMRATRTQVHAFARDHSLMEALTSVAAMEQVEPAAPDAGVGIALLAETFRDKRLRAIMHQYEREAKQMLEQFVCEAQQAGELRPEVDAAQLALLLKMYWSGHMLLEVTDPDYDPRALETAFRTLLQPLLRDAKDKAAVTKSHRPHPPARRSRS